MKNIFIIAALVFFTCCSEKIDHKFTPKENDLKSITVSTYGGAMGYNESFTMRTDSLLYNLHIQMDSTKNRRGNVRNVGYKLDGILKQNQVEEFSKIKGSESRQPVDGTDNSITVETATKRYTIVNGEKNVLWSSIYRRIVKVKAKEFPLDN